MARILVVEDSGLVARLIEKGLNTGGHEVLVAKDGAAGLRLFAAGGVELVLTDLAMPGLDGIGLIEAIRSSDGAVPILVLTATPERGGLDRLPREAVQGVRAKPLSPSQVRSWVDQTLAVELPG